MWNSMNMKSRNSSTLLKISSNKSSIKKFQKYSMDTFIMVIMLKSNPIKLPNRLFKMHRNMQERTSSYNVWQWFSTGTLQDFI